jgi:hypothetical protein
MKLWPRTYRFGGQGFGAEVVGERGERLRFVGGLEAV